MEPNIPTILTVGGRVGSRKNHFANTSDDMQRLPKGNDLTPREWLWIDSWAPATRWGRPRISHSLTWKIVILNYLENSRYTRWNKTPNKKILFSFLSSNILSLTATFMNFSSIFRFRTFLRKLARRTSSCVRRIPKKFKDLIPTILCLSLRRSPFSSNVTRKVKLKQRESLFGQDLSRRCFVVWTGNCNLAS